MKKTNLIEQLFNQHQEKLKEMYPGLKLARLLLDYEDYGKEMSAEEFCDRLLQGEPLEYILQTAYFYRSEFFVNSDVLIPRSETEILVELAVEFSREYSKREMKVWEIGTGSGAIGLSYLQEMSDKEISLIMSDISEAALQVAKKNLEYLKLTDACRLVKKDRLEGVTDKFDLILTNPPYIKKSADMERVHPQAVKYEPHVSLFLEDEEYESWFTDLFKQAISCLVSGGVFMMEGHEDHLQDLRKIATRYFCNVEIKHDYTHRERFLLAYKY